MAEWLLFLKACFRMLGFGAFCGFFLVWFLALCVCFVGFLFCFYDYFLFL